MQPGEKEFLLLFRQEENFLMLQRCCCWSICLAANCPGSLSVGDCLSGVLLFMVFNPLIHSYVTLLLILDRMDVVISGAYICCLAIFIFSLCIPCSFAFGVFLFCLSVGSYPIVFSSFDFDCAIACLLWFES